MHKLTSNLEETDIKDLIMKKKGETRYLREHKKKLAERNWLENYKKVQLSRREV